MYNALISLYPGNLLKLYNFGKVPRNDTTFIKAKRERRDWVYAIILTTFGPFSGLWQLSKMMDTIPLTQ